MFTYKTCYVSNSHTYTVYTYTHKTYNLSNSHTYSVNLYM